MTLDRNYVLAWSALHASITVAVVATVALASRYGVPEPGTTRIIAFVAVAWLLINVPIFATSLFRALGTRSRLLSNIGVLTLGCLAMVLGAGWFLREAAALPLIAAGIAAFTAQCLGVLRRPHAHLMWLVFPMAAVTGLSLAGIAWGEGYLSPTFEEGLTRERGSLDELFHIAVSNMIRTYGRPSSGLDGLPYLPYHTGSHYALAALGQLVGANGIQVYNLTFPIVFLPLFVFTLHAAAMTVVRRHVPAAGVSSIFILWFVPMTIIGGVLPVVLADALALWMSSLTSESMCLGLILLFCALASVFPSITTEGAPEVKCADRVVAAGGAPILVTAITAAKVSVGVVLASLALYVYLRFHNLRTSALAAVTTAASAAAFLVTYLFASEPARHMSVVPFDFVRSYIERTLYRVLYFPLSLAWLTTVICVGLAARKVRSNGVQDSFRNGDLIELEIIVVAAIASLGPGLLLRIDAGSAFYFIDIQRWVCVLFLIPFAIEALSMVKRWSATSWRFLDLRWTLAWLALALILAVSIGTMIANSAHRLRIVGRIVLADRGAASVGSRELVIQVARSGGEGRPPEPARLDLLDTLRAIERLPRFERRRTVLYIPKTNRVYWDFFSTPQLRKAIPFVAPAVAGVAMIDGLPDPDPNVAWTAYGYDVYALPREPQGRSSLEGSRDDVLRKAERAGFARVIVVYENSDGIGVKEWCVETTISCVLLRVRA